MDVEFLRYKFEDGHSGIITKNGLKIGVRYIQMVYMIAGAVVMGFIRGSIADAVLAMNEHTRRGDPYIQIHQWDRRIQGAILSSFFFGYALMLLPAELCFRRIGGKLVFTVMLAVNGAICVAMPTIANKGGWVAVSNAMLFMGTAHAGFSSVNQALIENWLPPSEKKPFSFLVYGGMQLGIVIGLPLSNLFSKMPLGWELVYYSSAMLAISMSVIYGILTASTPDKHEAIGDKEKEFITEAQSCYNKKVIPKPWRLILRSAPFWAVASSHAASNAIFIFYLADVPAYLKMFHKYPGWFAMLPFLWMWLIHVLTAPTLDWLSNLRIISYLFSVTHFRKLINFLCACGIVVGLTYLSHLGSGSGHSEALAGVVLIALLGLLGAQFSGFLSSYKDMSENHAGTLMMMGCVFSSFVGAAVPFITGLIIGNDMMDAGRWRAVFLTLASVYVLGNAVYTVLGSHQRQHWDLPVRRALLHYNGIIDANQIQLEEYSDVQLDNANKERRHDTAI